MSKKNIHHHRVRSSTGKIQGIALLPSGAAVTMLSPDAGSKPASIKLEDEHNTTHDYYNWGADNNWPTEIRQKVEKSTTAYPLMFKAVSLIFGDGVTYYRQVKTGSDKHEIKFDPIAEIDDFFEANDIDFFMIEQLMDFKFFGNTFQEMIFNNLSTKVLNLFHKEAEFSRLSKQNENTFEIETLGYAGNWTEDTPVPIPLYQKKRSVEDNLKIAKKKKKLANHTWFPSPGRTYYAMPPHGGLYRKNGWLDFSNKLPEIMNAMLDNQLSVKYHVQIPYEYWPSIYSEWDEWDDKKKSTKIDEKLEEMDEWLTGAENGYKTFISHFATDPTTHKPIPGWKIEHIDDRVSKDEWIPGTQEADQQIARALQIDPSMAGIQAQGGKLGAGSGSDKRTGFQNAVSLSKAEQKILFEPLYLIKRINNWPKDVQFAFSHTMPTKLDENPTGSEKQL